MGRCKHCRHHCIDGYCAVREIETYDWKRCEYFKLPKDAVSVCIAIGIMSFALNLWAWGLFGYYDANVGEPDRWTEQTQFITPINDHPMLPVEEPKNEEEAEDASDPEPPPAPEQIVEAQPDPKPIEEPKPVTPSSVLTRAGGVNYYNGMRETWYSSNVLRHYMTSRWHTDDNGVWHDSDGYVIISSSDMPYGTVHETSLGMGKVYDSGCPSGTVDIYVSW